MIIKIKQIPDEDFRKLMKSSLSFLGSSLCSLHQMSNYLVVALVLSSLSRYNQENARIRSIAQSGHMQAAGIQAKKTSLSAPQKPIFTFTVLACPRDNHCSFIAIG